MAKKLETKKQQSSAQSEPIYELSFASVYGARLIKQVEQDLGGSRQTRNIRKKGSAIRKSRHP